MKTRFQSGCAGIQSMSRCEAMRIGSLAGGLSLGQLLKLEAAQKDYESVEGTAKNVIQIRLNGGVAAQESWNPKPDAPVKYRGPFGVTKTSIPGIVLSETMPQTAKIAERVAGTIRIEKFSIYNMKSIWGSKAAK